MIASKKLNNNLSVYAFVFPYSVSFPRRSVFYSSFYSQVSAQDLEFNGYIINDESSMNK